jgi:hypothetical protein
MQRTQHSARRRHPLVRHRIATVAALVAAVTVAPLVAAGTASAAAATPASGTTVGPGLTDASLVRSPELSETSRLADRRTIVTGDRFYSMSAADTTYPATGWHIRGEMGGFWSQPIKLLDGIWFGLDGAPVGPARRTTDGWGYVRTDLPTTDGVQVSRTDFVPDGVRAGLIGLTLRSSTARSVTLTVDAHSELMSSYPWGETTPSQLSYNLPDTGSFDGRSLVFRETGTPPVANASSHDWAAMVGSSLRPTTSELGPNHRGPQDPAVICPASGPNTPPAPAHCDDTAYGKGTGGRLTYQVPVSAGRPRTVWFAISGSDQGPAEARAAQRTALADPAGLLARKVRGRERVSRWSSVDLPGDRLLQQSVDWSKQNLADSVQGSRDLQLRPSNTGKTYPAPVGTLASAQWFGAGFPDYPWLFGTDGEYTAFPAVAAGQFESIEAHLRALRDVSDIVNQRSGKVAHEVTPDGQVYFGTNSDPGNTDETAKFPSAVALVWRWTGDDGFRDDLYDFTVRNMRYIYATLDADGDGWPEGLGNVERAGMGEEKLDNAVYTIRGLRDLADLATSKGDAATATWASDKAAGLESAFEATWWMGDTSDQYADSLSDPGNVKVFQRHWIGLTPTDAVLVRPGRVPEPLSSTEHASLVLDKRQEACYSDEFGLYHTGTGPTSATGGNHGATCDSDVSTVQSERSIFTLGTSIMAVSEGNYGRLGSDQQQRYTIANARVQLDPAVWEMPGAMPEISPSPDFGSNIDKAFTDRSMVLQAWGTYGILWPVVSQQLGVQPDIGRDHVTVVPQVPDGQQRIAGHRIRVGDGSVDVTARRTGGVLTTGVRRDVRASLTIGVVLPAGASGADVRLDGHRVTGTVRQTARGTELVVELPSGTGTSTLSVRTR